MCDHVLMHTSHLHLTHLLPHHFHLTHFLLPHTSHLTHFLLPTPPTLHTSSYPHLPPYTPPPAPPPPTLHTSYPTTSTLHTSSYPPPPTLHTSSYPTTSHLTHFLLPHHLPPYTPPTLPLYTLCTFHVHTVSQCDYRCPPPPIPTNGRLANIIYPASTNSTLVLGTVAVFVCDAGFYLAGSASRTCRENGMWSDQVTRCYPCKLHCI